MDVGSRRTRWRTEEAIRFLVDHGADLTIRDEEYGGTPLGWARYAGRDEAVDLLRSLGALD
jgi:ankyrin repeat protein